LKRRPAVSVMSSARLLLVLVFAGACSLESVESYLIAGLVVDSQSHAPLSNVRVSLAPAAALAQKLEQVTKQDGRFSFVVSKAGKYSLRIAKPGYPLQGYRQAGFVGVQSAIVAGDDQDTGHVVFEASRGGAITGQIKDEKSEPVGNALVSVFQSSIVGGERKIITRGQTRANDAGEFRLSYLPRGNYYVCAMGRPWFADSLIQFQELQESVNRSFQRVTGPAQSTLRPEPSDGQPVEPDQSAPKYSPDPSLGGTAFLTTFYPRARSVEEATLIRVYAGGETQVSITLPLTKGVTAKGTISVPGEMSEGRANLYKKVYDQYMLFLEGWVSKEGAFQFKNVPAGSYEIVATSDAASGASSWHIRQEVEVGAFDIEVTLRPPPMGSVSGHVLFEGERPASTATLFVSLRNERGTVVRNQVDLEGSFSLSRLAAGRYEVTAGSADYIAAYFAGPGGEHLPLTLEVASGENVRRELMLTRAVSMIKGTVENAGVPQIGAFVLLMPKDRSQRWAYRVDQTDTDGSYSLATIPSGDYFLIALSDGTDVAYRDAKVGAMLTRVAKQVHVEPGHHLEMKVDVVGAATLNLPLL
jgi:hypothetical protein